MRPHFQHWGSKVNTRFGGATPKIYHIVSQLIQHICSGAYAFPTALQIKLCHVSFDVCIWVSLGTFVPFHLSICFLGVKRYIFLVISKHKFWDLLVKALIFFLPQYHLGYSFLHFLINLRNNLWIFIQTDNNNNYYYCYSYYCNYYKPLGFFFFFFEIEVKL